jgi:hypothetical protein
MKKRIIQILLFGASLSFFSCNSDIDANRPEVLIKPKVVISVVKDTVQVADTSVIVGPAVDYEQSSKVVYEIKVKSDNDLKKFEVTTTSLNRSLKNGVIRSVPANVLDANGNFTQPVREVTLYYSYNILATDVAGTPISVAFNVLNNSDAETTKKTSFTPILAGSTSGKIFQVWSKVMLNSVNVNFDMPHGSVQEYLTYSLFSIEKKMGFVYSSDAMNYLSDINFFVNKNGSVLELVSPTHKDGTLFYVNSVTQYAPFKSVVSQMQETVIKKVTKQGVDINGNPVVLSYKDNYLLITHDNKLDSILGAVPLPTTKSEGMKLGDVFAFRSAKGVKGFILVTAAGSSSTSASATLEIKYLVP